MKYPVTFSDDLKYLAAYYNWNDEDKKEVRQAFTNCEPMVRYFTILAAAHRAGYAQDAANGFIRLQAWCIEKGLGDPFAEHFDPAALDAIKVEPRVAA
jgi:hypothetical protein